MVLWLKEIIHLHNVVKSFNGVKALDGLTFSFPKGINGFLGPNGAGKSTTLLILMGLLKREKGEVRVLGMDPVIDGISVRNKLGFSPEFDVLNIEIEADKFIVHMGMISGLTREEAVKRLGRIEVFLDIGEEIKRPLNTLSHGMKQKVKLAIALIHDPEILLLDEPTTGLDPIARVKMLKLIKVLKKELDKDIILSTHILRDVEEICDYIVIINEGKKVIDGDKRSLIGKISKRIAVRISPYPDPVNLKFVSMVRESGLNAWYDNDENFVYITPKGKDYDKIKRLVLEILAENGLPLIIMREQPPTFEDVFKAVIGDDQ